MRYIKNAPYILLLSWCFITVIVNCIDIFKGISRGGDSFYVYNMKMYNYQTSYMILGLISIVCMMCICARLYLSNRNKTRIKSIAIKYIWLLGFVLYGIWIIISTIFSEDIELSVTGSVYRYEGLFTYIIYFAILVISLNVNGENKKQSLLISFLGLGSVTSIVMLFQQQKFEWALHAFSYDSYNRNGIFMHSNHMGYFLNLMIILAVAIFVFFKNKKIRILSLIGLILNYYCLMVNDTFGAIIASFAANLIIIVLFFIKKGKEITKRDVILAFIPLIIMLILIAMSYFGLIPTEGSTMRDNFGQILDDADRISKNEDIARVGTNRIGLWKYYLSLIPNHPIVGYGLENPMTGRPDKWSDRPANELITIALYVGIPGVIFYLLGLFSLAFKALKNLRNLSISAVVSGACIVTYLISSLCGNSTYYITCYFWMFIGILISDIVKE